MFDGMMDPELIKLAQEQMSRMSPAEFAKIQQQVMSNPDLMKMASESMKSMRPEDLRMAAEQLKHTRPEEMAEIGEKMGKASPEEIAAMRARVDAQVTYELNAAQMLKNQGNKLHSQGKYNDALQKYLLAKKNLEGIPSSKGRSLMLACSLNLMSCYLKMKQYDECIKEGTEALEYDSKNVKALYRRGQAYKELSRFGDAVKDLTKAHEVSPDDEIIANVLRDAKERLTREGGFHAPSGVVIEEIIEEVDTASENNDSSVTESSFTQPQESSDMPKNESSAKNGSWETNAESLQALKDNPESIRSFQNFISGADPETLAAISGGKAGEISPEMFKTAANMIGKMSPEELQKMLQMASTFQGDASGDSFNSFGPGAVPANVTPDMLKTASDMMSGMPPEELQKMFDMASSLRGRNSVPTAAPPNTSSDNGSKMTESQQNFSRNENNEIGETSSSSDLFSSSRSTPQSSFPSSTSDLQEQMRNQMKDPAMRQMFASMMKNMSPEMMANMSEQFGMKLSREDAEKAQQAMSSLSPEDLDKMMRWMDRIQRGAEGAKKAKNWLLGRPGMILAILMLILAVILHWLGFIGK